MIVRQFHEELLRELNANGENMYSGLRIMVRIRDGFTGDTHVHEVAAFDNLTLKDGERVITINPNTEPEEEVAYTDN